jgi:hypothetical protein
VSMSSDALSTEATAAAWLSLTPVYTHASHSAQAPTMGHRNAKPVETQDDAKKTSVEHNISHSNMSRSRAEGDKYAPKMHKSAESESERAINHERSDAKGAGKTAKNANGHPNFGKTDADSESEGNASVQEKRDRSSGHHHELAHGNSGSKQGNLALKVSTHSHTLIHS